MCEQYQRRFLDHIDPGQLPWEGTGGDEPPQTMPLVDKDKFSSPLELELEQKFRTG